MGGLPVQSKKCLKIYLSPAHRSEGPWPLNPPQASVHSGNKNGGTREEDAAPGGAQQSDSCSGSRDTDLGQSPGAQPAARPMVSEAEPHPCSQGLKHPHHCQPPDKPHPAIQAGFQPLKGSSSGLPKNLTLGNPACRGLGLCPLHPGSEPCHLPCLQHQDNADE